jgi:hypothetical protein
MHSVNCHTCPRLSRTGAGAHSFQKQFLTERNYPWRPTLPETTTGSGNRRFQMSVTNRMTTTRERVQRFLDSSRGPSNIRIVKRIEVAASEVS